MPLTIGNRLGPYEIVAPLGAGGMGEVYRARDTKLNRDVALKILPDAFASDPDRLARLTREAQTLASLNHSNIAAIYGIEESGGVRALVMELVDGEDLSQRIARGAIPLDETLPIARQIADALEEAHEQGIIHRDLKPANIKLRPDGTVKVLDFGLAKAMEPASATRANAMSSPTLSMHATQAGIILGTAAYMSPEQAAGKPVDKRSDLWAFGVVVYEMLTGRPVFAGETVSHVLAAVLKSDPDWTALPAHTPAPIRRLLRRCLDKDRKRRLDSAADARLEIDEALAPIGDANTVRVTMQEAAWRRVLPWAATGALAAGLAAVLVLWVPWRKASPPAPLRLEATLGADASLVIADTGAPAGAAVVSPDGTQLAFVAQPHGSAPRPLRAAPRPADRHATGGHRKRRGPVFFAGWPVARLFWWWQAQEDRGHRRRAGDARRRAGRTRRELGRGRDDCLYVHREQQPVARSGGEWDGRAADDAGPRGSGAPVAAGAARRPGRPLHGERRGRQLHERLARRAAAAHRHAPHRAARRLLRPLSR